MCRQRSRWPIYIAEARALRKIATRRACCWLPPPKKEVPTRGICWSSWPKTAASSPSRNLLKPTHPRWFQFHRKISVPAWRKGGFSGGAVEVEGGKSSGFEFIGKCQNGKKGEGQKHVASARRRPERDLPLVFSQV